MEPVGIIFPWAILHSKIVKILYIIVKIENQIDARYIPIMHNDAKNRR